MEFFERFFARFDKQTTTADPLRRVREALEAAGESSGPLTFYLDDVPGSKRSATGTIVGSMPHLAVFRARTDPRLSALPALSNLPRRWDWGPQRAEPGPPDAAITWDDLVAIAEGVPRRFPVSNFRVWVEAPTLTDQAAAFDAGAAPPLSPMLSATPASHLRPELCVWSEHGNSSGRRWCVALSIRLPPCDPNARNRPAFTPSLERCLAALGAKSLGMSVLVGRGELPEQGDVEALARGAREGLPHRTAWSTAFPSLAVKEATLRSLLVAALGARGWKWAGGRSGQSGYGAWQTATMARSTPADNQLTLEVDISGGKGLTATLHFKGVLRTAFVDVHKSPGRADDLADEVATIALRADYLAERWGHALDRLSGRGARWFRPTADEHVHLAVD